MRRKSITPVSRFGIFHFRTQYENNEPIAQASNIHPVLADFEDNWATKLLLRYELAKQRKDLKVRP
jgi:hypothetical protein